jgi:predicted transcriptional regulator
LNFRELIALSRITQGTTVEKFGSLINASYFDGANLAGTLKTKGAIDFKVSYPGESEVIITEEGKKILQIAEEKSKEGFDNLDLEILQKILQGSNKPEEIEKALNINQQDIALRLYKLSKQNFLSYTLKGSEATLSLTEAGYKKATEKIEKEEAKEAKSEAKEEAKKEGKTEEAKEAKEGIPLKLLLLIILAIILIALLLFLIK